MRPGKILFVCTGNMIRSPMGEYFLQKTLSDRGVTDILCESAGTLAMDGNPAIGTAVDLMAECSIDMRSHRSRGLTAQMLEETDMIVCMEIDHLNYCLKIAPHCSEKMHLLGNFIKDDVEKEIDDPIGGMVEDYERARERIKQGVTSLADKIVEERNSETSKD